MEQPEKVEEYQDYDAKINQDERKIEARAKQANAKKVDECLEMKFVGRSYDTQFARTGKKKKYLCVTCTP